MKQPMVFDSRSNDDDLASTFKPVKNPFSKEEKKGPPKPKVK